MRNSYLDQNINDIVEEMPGIPIEKLQLSVRASNVLHRMSIKYVEQLMETPLEKVLEQRNAGAKTIAEIEKIKEQIETNALVLSTLEMEQYPEIEATSFSDDQLYLLSQYSISEMNLPTRAYNYFMRNGFTTVDKVVTSPLDINEIKGLGKKTVSGTILAIQSWLKDNCIQPKIVNENAAEDPKLKEYYLNIEKALRPLGSVYWEYLLQCSKQAGLFDSICDGGYATITDDNFKAVLEIPELETILKTFFLSIAPKGIIREDTFIDFLHKKELCFSEKILLNRICDGELGICRNGYIFLNRPKFIDYLENNASFLNERSLQILKRRIGGDSLQVIADDYGLTRERIRQILVGSVKKFPAMYEDYYCEPYESFKLSKNEFCDIFPSCGASGYEYLFIKYEKGNQELSEENVQEYRGLFFDRINEYFRERMILYDNMTTSKTDIVYRVLISNSDQSLSMEDFEKAYNEYIDTKGYPRERFEFNLHTVANHLRTAKHIVFNKNNCVRYCDADIKEIWNKIDFDKYKDLVISATLIYKDYKELMDNLDIRDGHELFYVIKTSLEYWDSSKFEITCRRVPVMVMGNGNECDQAIRLLKELSPISYGDYYEAYEERFGLHKESVIGNSNISGVLADYYVDGHYVIDVPLIDKNDMVSLRNQLLTRKIWFIDDLEKLFREVCINSSEDALNSATFKKIGFVLNTGYAYEEKYGLASNFFEEEVFAEKEVIDLNKLDRRLFALRAFVSVLDKKKKNLEYIEVAPKILMKKQTVKEHYGIGDKEIRYLQNNIANQRNEKFFNARSIWNEISKDPIVQMLQGNEWMCTCIFRRQDNISSLLVAGGIILCKNYGELNIGKICEWIVKQKGKMTIKNLANEFNNTFGTAISYYKLGLKLKTANIWDDLILDSVDNYVNLLIENAELEKEDFFKEEFF